MLKSSGVSLIFENPIDDTTQQRGMGFNNWLLEKKVRVQGNLWDGEEDLGDSCCFGTRSMEIGLDYVWKLHEGV